MERANKEVLVLDIVVNDSELKKVAGRVSKVMSDINKNVGSVGRDMAKNMEITNKKIVKSTQTMTSSIKNQFKGLKTVIAGAFAYFTIQGVEKLYTDARRATVAFGLIKDNMGEYAEEFRKWVYQNGATYGLAIKDAMEFGSTYSLLVASFTKTPAENFYYSQELLRASAVIASKTGREMSDVMNRIRSGLLGSTEAIEDLGIFVNISLIETTEAFKKVAKGMSWSKLDFQTQQYIRTLAILEQANKKFGNTLGDMSEYLVFKAMLDNLKFSLGQAFMPIVNTVLPILSSFISKIITAINAVGEFTKTLFGRGREASIKSAESVATSTSAISDNIKAQEELGDAVVKAGKKAKRGVAELDEVVTLQKDLASAVAGAAGGIGATAGVPIESIETVEEEDIVGTDTTFIDKIGEKLSFLEGPISLIKERFEEIWESVKKIGTIIYDNIIKPFANWVVEFVLPPALGILANVLGIISEILKSIGRTIEPFYTEHIKPIVTIIADILVGALERVEEVTGDIYDWTVRNPQLIDKATTSVMKLLTAWLGVKIALKGMGLLWAGVELLAAKELAKDTAPGLLGKLKQRLAEMKKTASLAWKYVAGLGSRAIGVLGPIGTLMLSVGKTFVSAILTIGRGLLVFFSSTVGIVVLVITGIIAAIYLVVTNWDKIKEAASAAWDKVKEIWGGVKEWFSSKVVEPVKTAFEGARDSVITAFTTAKDKVTEAWDTIQEWFNSKVIEPIKNGFESVKENIVNAFTTAKDNVIGAWETITEWFSSSVMEPIKNVFSDGWDNIINKVTGIWSKVTEIWGRAKDWFDGKVLQPLKSTFEEVFKLIYNNMITGFETAINSVVDGINTIIKAINKIRIEVPDHVPKFGGTTFAVNLPTIGKISIPRMADGGIVNGYTEFIAGERGAEVIMPLENSRFLDNFATKLANKLGGSSKGDVVINVGNLIGDRNSAMLLVDIIEKAMAERNSLSGNMYSGVNWG